MPALTGCAAHQCAEEQRPSLSQPVLQQNGGSHQTESGSSEITLAGFPSPCCESAALLGPQSTPVPVRAVSPSSSRLGNAGRSPAGQLALSARQSSSPLQPLATSATSPANSKSTLARRLTSEQQPASAQQTFPPAAAQASPSRGLTCSASGTVGSLKAPAAFVVVSSGSLRVPGNIAAAPPSASPLTRGRNGRPHSAASTPRSGDCRDAPCGATAAASAWLQPSGVVAPQLAPRAGSEDNVRGRLGQGLAREPIRSLTGPAPPASALGTAILRSTGTGAGTSL